MIISRICRTSRFLFDPSVVTERVPDSPLRGRFIRHLSRQVQLHFLSGHKPTMTSWRIGSNIMPRRWSSTSGRPPLRRTLRRTKMTSGRSPCNGRTVQNARSTSIMSSWPLASEEGCPEFPIFLERCLALFSGACLTVDRKFWWFRKNFKDKFCTRRNTRRPETILERRLSL